MTDDAQIPISYQENAPLSKMATSSLFEEPMSLDTMDTMDTGVTIREDDSNSTDHMSVQLPVPPVPVETISDNLATREWMDGQLYDQLSHMGSDKVDVPLTEDIEMARARVGKLQEELLSESSKLSVKEQTLKRLQLGSALTKELFGPTDAETDSSNKRELEEVVLKQSKLVTDILKEAGELETLRTDLKNLREKNFEMKARNRQSMNQIRQQQNLLDQKADDFRKDKDGQRKKEQLEDEIKKIVILRHTLQGLILGSGINWAEDPAMEELLLSLGEPLNF